MHRRAKRMLALAAVALSLGGVAWAEAKHEAIRGRVTATTDTSITVSAVGKDGKPASETFGVDAETVYAGVGAGLAADLAADALAAVTTADTGATVTASLVAVYKPAKATASSQHVVTLAGHLVAGKSAKWLAGKIKSVAAGSFVLTTKAGDVTVKTDDKSLVFKVVDKTKADVAKDLVIRALLKTADGGAKTGLAVVMRAKS